MDSASGMTRCGRVRGTFFAAGDHLPSACDQGQDKGMIGGRQGMKQSKPRYRSCLQLSLHANNFHRQLHRQSGYGRSLALGR
jgi:hypothetical protein